MKIVDCCREQDVVDALSSGRWPDRADEDLRAHVATCEICTDVIDVAGALLAFSHDHSADASNAPIPSSAVMWWRAQMRARQEAVREAARPITVAQVVASVAGIAITVIALVALFPWVVGATRTWISGAGEAAAAVQVPTVLLTHGWILPALIIGVWLVLAPVAIYFAVADD